MQAALNRLAAALRLLTRRGKVVNSRLTPQRVLVQLSLRAGETKQDIELLLPYGMSAYPPAGEVLIVEVAAAPDHLIALGADDPALRIQDLLPSEFGFRDKRGTQIVFRVDRLEVTTPLPVVMNSGAEISFTSATKIRLQAPILEFQARETYRLDVAGYAQDMTWSGAGDAYTQTTWFTGAVITPVVHAVSPPGVFNGP